MNKRILFIALLSAVLGCKPVEETSANADGQIIQQYHEGLRAYFKGDYAAADNMATRVIALNPQHDGALYLKSKIYYDQGRLDESAKFLLEAGMADPNNEYLNWAIAKYKDDPRHFSWDKRLIQKESKERRLL